jgi:hypothetical protein
MSAPVVYLGDGLYALLNGKGQLELRANDFEHPTDIVYLEADVLDTLLRFLKDNTNALERLK